MLLYFIYCQASVVIYRQDVANQVLQLRSDVDPFAEAIVDCFYALYGLLEGGCFERADPILHAIENDPEGPDIGRIAVAEASSNLRGQEIGCTACLSLELLIGLKLARKPEVPDFDMVVSAKKTVAELEATLSEGVLAMEDFPAVQVLDSLENLHAVPPNVVFRRRNELFALFLQSLCLVRQLLHWGSTPGTGTGSQRPRTNVPGTLCSDVTGLGESGFR